MVLARKLDAKLLVRWDLNEDCPYRFEELFRCDRVGTYQRPATQRDVQRLRPLAVRYQRLNAKPHEVRATFESKQMAILPFAPEFEYLFLEALQELRPNVSIAERVRICSRKFRRRTVGVHLRRSEALDYRGLNRENMQAYDSALFDAVLAQTRLSPPEETAVFLASDSRKYAQEWTRRLRKEGLHVVTANVTWGKALRETTGADAVTDMLLMARCDLILKSCYSSLMMIAEWLSGKVERNLTPMVLLSEKQSASALKR